MRLAGSAPLALWCLALACKPSPSAKPDDPTGTAVHVEAEPSAAAVPVDAQFLFVSFGGSTGGYRFWVAVDKGGPAVVTAIFPQEESWPEPIAAFVRSKLELEDFYENPEPVSFEVDRAMIDALALTPREPIWLVGPEGPCAARLTTPRLSVYAPAWPVVEVSWRIEGCSVADPKHWAPIAIVAETLPDQLRWIGASAPVEQAIEPNAWQSRYAPLLAAKIASGDFPAAADAWVSRETTVPGTALVQLDVAAKRLHRPEPGEEYNECFDSESIMTAVGLWKDGDIEPVGMPSDQSQELVGAFVQGAEVVWTVHEQWFNAVVAAPGRAQPLAQVGVAATHPEDNFGWSVVAYCGP